MLVNSSQHQKEARGGTPRSGRVPPRIVRGTLRIGWGTSRIARGTLGIIRGRPRAARPDPRTTRGGRVTTPRRGSIPLDTGHSARPQCGPDAAVAVNSHRSKLLWPTTISRARPPGSTPGGATSSRTSTATWSTWARGRRDGGRNLGPGSVGVSPAKLRPAAGSASSWLGAPEDVGSRRRGGRNRWLSPPFNGKHRCT